jgi:hypothetical protein
MYCTRCRSPMILTERMDQPGSVQTWYQCPTCSGQRLVSVDTRRSSLGNQRSRGSALLTHSFGELGAQRGP